MTDIYKVRVFQNGGYDWPKKGNFIFHRYDGELYQFKSVEHTIFTNHVGGNYVFGTVKLIHTFNSVYQFQDALQYAPEETSIEFIDCPDP